MKSSCSTRRRCCRRTRARMRAPVFDAGHGAGVAAERAADHHDVATIERRHARYFLEYCEHAAEDARTDRREGLERLAQERRNIRLAFERLLRAGAVDEALRVAMRSRALPWDAHVHEVRGWLAQALGAATPAPALRASALYWDGQPRCPRRARRCAAAAGGGAGRGTRGRRAGRGGGAHQPGAPGGRGRGSRSGRNL